MVLLFTHQNSQRVHYIFNEVIGARLGVSFQITTDWSFFKESNAQTKIAHTDIQPLKEDFLDFLWVYNSGLLSEDLIRERWNPVSCDVLYFDSQASSEVAFSLPFSHFEALFLSPTSELNGESAAHTASFSKNCVPFDAFSEIFWCLSRYEEYQWEIAQKDSRAFLDSHNISTQPPNNIGKLNSPDLHGRYPAKQSLLFQKGWLDIPIADKLIWLIGYCINKKPLDQFEVIPTADIDMALRFAGRSFVVKTGSLIKDAFLRPVLILERIKTIINKRDPYQMDVTTLPLLTHSKKYKVFILNHRKRTNRNKQVNPETLKNELRRIKEVYDTPSENWGIHPSWQDESDEINTQKEWKWEKTELENNFGVAVTQSRLHYIHLRLPNSYQILEQLGITDDWSMGYPEASGFRAGTSKPYLWYDLTLEKSTGLRVHPFCIMDVTCKNYLNLSDFISSEKGNQIKQELQIIGGSFCFIFHNESVSNTFPWNGWKNTIYNWAETPFSQNNQASNKS